MRRRTIFGQVLLSGLALWGLSLGGFGLRGAGVSAAQAEPEAATGLKFLSPEQLRAIPLAELPYAGFQVPEAVDLSAHMPPPGHQHKQNSCVAWVSAYAVKTYQEQLEQHYRLIRDGRPDWQRIFSPAFVYNQINQGRDGGATLVDALNLLSSRGALSWAEMPYDPDDVTRQPSADQLKKARRFRIAYWRQVNPADPMEMKAQLQAGYPVMIGALIDDAFYHLKAGQIWSHDGGKSRGGHALVVVGYDDAREAFKVLNSWGSHWAEQGYGWIGYSQFRRVVREAYVAKDAFDEVPAERVLHQPQTDSLKPAPQPAATLATAENKSKKQNELQPPLQSEEELVPGLRVEQQRQEHQKLIFSGQALLDPTQGQRVRVLVKFYRDAQGRQALDLQASTYKLPNAQGIAIGSEQLAQAQLTWSAQIPLDQLPASLHVFWAQPVLYLDDFGIETGPLVRVELTP